MRLEWSGDVDLNDGSLTQSYSKYRNRLQRILKFGLGSDADTKSLIPVLILEFTEDLQFVQSGNYEKHSLFTQCSVYAAMYLCSS